MRSSPESSGSTETPLGGWGIFGFPVHQRASGLPRGLRFPCGLAKSVFGPAATGCSGLRAGDRAGLGDPSGLPQNGGRIVRLDGGGGFLRRSRCPAPEVGLPCKSWLSVGRCRSNFGLRFSAGTASLPRVGKPAKPGPRGFRQEAARRSQPAEAGARKGAGHGSGSRPARGALPGDLERRKAAARCPSLGRDPSGPRPRPGDRSCASHARLALCEDAGPGAGKSAEERRARPGEFAPLGEVSVLAALYRSRQARYPRAKADQERTRRCNRVELDPALEAPGLCPLFRGTPQGDHLAAPGASLITAADSPIQPKFCGADPISY